MILPTELGNVTLKELVRHNPEYVRVYPKINVLYAIARNVPCVIAGKKCLQSVDMTVKLPCFFYVRTVEETDDKRVPDEIHFNDSNAKTFLTLLAHKPDSIEIEYYPNGMSKEWVQKTGVRIEMLFIKALFEKFIKKTFEVAIHHALVPNNPCLMASYGT